MKQWRAEFRIRTHNLTWRVMSLTPEQESLPTTIRFEDNFFHDREEVTATCKKIVGVENGRKRYAVARLNEGQVCDIISVGDTPHDFSSDDVRRAKKLTGLKGSSPEDLELPLSEID